MDTPNTFVTQQFPPERGKQISKEIEEKVGQNTLEEMNRRLGYPLGGHSPAIKCPHCGKEI
jgi:hypothetical protein